jgi:hypothetical protein|tara:strand:- start:148 stop:618 length:471 start_codon:yes stop_codon:yes gene_type:complete
MTTRKAAQDEPIPVDALDSDSDEIVLDFSAVQDIDPLPDDAPYLCMVTKFEPGKARSGQGKVDVEFNITEPKEFENRKLFRTYSLQPQALFSLYQTLTALGEDPNAMKDKMFKVQPENYIGREAVVFIRNETYEDVVRSRPRRVTHRDTWDQATAF